MSVCSYAIFMIHSTKYTHIFNILKYRLLHSTVISAKYQMKNCACFQGFADVHSLFPVHSSGHSR